MNHNIIQDRDGNILRRVGQTRQQRARQRMVDDNGIPYEIIEENSSQDFQMAPSQLNCGNCYFSRILMTEGQEQPTEVLCRRRSPSHEGYPTRPIDDWCGEYRSSD